MPTALVRAPDATARAAERAFPNSNCSTTLSRTLGPIFANPDFADLYAHRGRLTEAMSRLALAFVLQHTEQLDDAEAAAAVRARLGWKQVLSLERDAPGLMPPSWSMFAPCCWRLAPKSGC